MLRLIRIAVGLIFWLGITLLFLDITGAIHGWLGWMAKVQFMPALLSLNVVAILFLVALTLLFGRVYCSTICPLGVFQDIVSWLSGRRKGKRYRFGYHTAYTTLRLVMLGVFCGAVVAGIGSIVALIEPYSAYGRMVSSLFAPLYGWVNNLIAKVAEHYDSYMFYEKDVWFKSLSVLIVAIVTFVAIVIMAWRKGRIYCNSICPVGTMLGVLSRYSFFGIKIDKSKCNECGLCSRGCKAQCINGKEHAVDYSRCVACMDCIEICRHGAISFTRRPKSVKSAEASPASAADMVDKTDNADSGRRSFLAIAGMVGTAAAVHGAEKIVDGGLAVIEDKKIPERQTPIAPAGAVSLKNLKDHCTACQLCISQCPNDVLRPSSELSTFMQPVVSYERGYCRPECNTCSSVCPAGAIIEVSPEEKSSIQVGHAVWVKANCVPLTDGVECGNCARHCPAGAITMIPSKAGDENSPKIPAVNTERCIGCGACENLCPARPFSAIYVEGHQVHRLI